MSHHTDIVATGWVSHLPDAAIPYVLLARLDRPIGAWLLFLPGFWGIGLTARGAALPWLLALFGAGAVLMRAAGCVVNDLWDRDLDRKVARTAARPLASGAIAPRQALMFLAALLVPSLAILLQLDRRAEILGVLSLVLVATYPLAKRLTWWPQLMLGATFGWGAPMGYAAGANRLGWVAAALYVAAIAWILGYDTIYAHQDREDDALIGIGSTALLSADHPRRFVGLSYAAMVAFLIAAGILARLSPAYFLLLAAAAALLAVQVIRLDIHDPARCLALFKANRDVGLVIGVALLAGRL